MRNLKMDTSPQTTLPEASPYARHLPQLDGIRGLAVLGVVASHFFPGYPTNAIARFAVRVFQFGATGVDLFFVLSGFLITGILYDSFQEPYFFRKFYARRVLRIFPLYYGVLFVFLLVGLAHHFYWNSALVTLALYLQNTAWMPLFSSPQLPLGHFWSLGIEEQFYLVWPLLIFFLRSRRKLLTFCFATILLLPGLKIWAFMHGFPYAPVHISVYFRSDTLLAGAALALLLRSKLHDLTLSVLPWFSAFIVLGFFIHPPIPDATTRVLSPVVQLCLRYTVLAIGYAGLIAWSLSGPSIARMLSARVLRELGKISYGIYVLHLILWEYLQLPVKHVVAHVTQSKPVNVILTGLIMFALSVAAATFSYQVYEKPFLRMKRYFNYKAENSAAASL